LAPTTESVAHEIVHNAISAGFNDNRFRPVHASELPYLVYKVDVLSTPENITSVTELDAKRYGVIVSDGIRRGLLLPDLEGIDTVEQQVAIARKKAGIDEGEPVRLQRFEVTRHE
jgi:AMMECR1 domain-containing protein